MKAILINNMTSGGAEKVVVTLLNEFKKHREPMHLICVGKDQFYEIPEGVKVHYLTDFDDLPTNFTKVYYLFSCAIKLKKLVKENEYTLIQSHLIAACFINIIAKVLGSSHFVQMVLHSWINFGHKSFWKKWLNKVMFRWKFNKADSMISIAQVMKEGVDDYLNLKNRTKHVVIHNPHPIAEIQELSEEAVDDFYFDPRKKYLITIARLTKGKRFEVLLEALKKLRATRKDVELIIIGDGPEKVAYEKRRNDLELNSFVHFLGYRKNPFPYLAQSDIFVMTSEWEGLPNILIEAMICKTPVISSDCISGPRDILHPNSNMKAQLKDRMEWGEFGILYPVGHVDLLVTSIFALLEDQVQYETYIQKGLERANNFEASAITRQYLETFPDYLKNYKMEFRKENISTE
ncbi:MAG: glycosyltransferase [Bacteroidota bacterium]